MGRTKPSSIQPTFARNYLADLGRTQDPAGSFCFIVPAGARFVVVVYETVPGAGCDGYLLRLSGFECPAPSLYISRVPESEDLRLHWTTASGGHQLEGTPTLDPFVFELVPESPVVSSNESSVIQSPSAPARFYRLHKAQ